MMRRFDLASYMQKNPWAWSAAAVVLIWLILSATTGRYSLSTLSGIVLSASFLTLVGIGQMFVVATGRGNIDLSIPSVMTLNAYIALIVIQGQDANLLVGLGVALLLAVTIGAINALLVVGLRIPSIIATLATGYVLATATLLANRMIPGFMVSPTLNYIAGARLAGLPVMTLVTLGVVVVSTFVLRFTAYGRMLSAVGQSRDAARLTGIRCGAVVTSAFLLSSLLASATGLLLGAYINGAFLEMGQSYLLQSIAAVVLGGTPIFGGAATAFGTFFASILLILLVSTMQVIGLPPGTQDMVQGVVVILVLALAGRKAGLGRARTIPALKTEAKAT